MTKRFTVVADVVFQAFYEVEASTQIEAKNIVESEDDVEAFEMIQVTSPMVTDVEVL